VKSPEEILKNKKPTNKLNSLFAKRENKIVVEDEPLRIPEVVEEI
jgi:hypothetical protein